MTKRIVVALGGNALGNNLVEQKRLVLKTASTIADLIEMGYQVTVSHGNGPQVGFIQKAMDTLTEINPELYPEIPLPTCVAITQGYIGYDLQNALQTELANRGISKPVVTVVTQIEVDPKDPAFQNPTKPIGRFMSKEEAEALAKETGCCVMEDAGRGYRQVVSSPKPVKIIELESIQTLVDAGHVVIACGGGGVAVVKEGNAYKEVAAIIDKDFCSELLAENLDADELLILTAVEYAYCDFQKDTQTEIQSITPDDMKKHIENGEFSPGSMLPKVEATVMFAGSKKGRKSVITLLEKAKQGINGEIGTQIQQ